MPVLEVDERAAEYQSAQHNKRDDAVKFVEAGQIVEEDFPRDDGEERQPHVAKLPLVLRDAGEDQTEGK